IDALPAQRSADEQAIDGYARAARDILDALQTAANALLPAARTRDEAQGNAVFDARDQAAPLDDAAAEATGGPGGLGRRLAGALCSTAGVPVRWQQASASIACEPA
ncbi:MAG: hypothetical protein D6725_10880, partial [Planctomycetota bacterium]